MNGSTGIFCTCSDPEAKLQFVIVIAQHQEYILETEAERPPIRTPIRNSNMNDLSVLLVALTEVSEIPVG